MGSFKHFIETPIDKEYFSAIKDNNETKIKKLVQTQAKKNGYTTGPVYHASDREFFVFDRAYTNPEARYGDGFYFSDSPETDFGDIIKEYYLKIQNAANEYEVGEQDLNADELIDFEAELKAKGFDAISGSGEIVVYNPNHIKLAELITKDKNGKVIPLSLRFNPKNPDVRF